MIKLRMSENKKKLICIAIVAFGFTFLTYFVLGSAFNIIAYNFVATLKLIVAHIVLFGILFFANFYVLIGVFTNKKLLFLAAIIAITLIILESKLFVLPDLFYFLDYIKTGDYLRDVHGINWYYMDWGGWDAATLLFSIQIYNFILFFLGKKLLMNEKLNKYFFSSK